MRTYFEFSERMSRMRIATNKIESNLKMLHFEKFYFPCICSMVLLCVFLAALARITHTQSHIIRHIWPIANFKWQKKSQRKLTQAHTHTHVNTFGGKYFVCLLSVLFSMLYTILLAYNGIFSRSLCRTFSFSIPTRKHNIDFDSMAIKVSVRLENSNSIFGTVAAAAAASAIVAIAHTFDPNELSTFWPSWGNWIKNENCKLCQYIERMCFSVSVFEHISKTIFHHTWNNGTYFSLSLFLRTPLI